MRYECILTAEQGDGALRTGVITLHRPKQMNALNDQLMDELGAALKAYDADDGIGCIVVTGSEKAFAADADIAAMAKYAFLDVYRSGYITRNWETMNAVRKPVIAAVAGFAPSGGCEVPLMADIVIAADNAKFGQPEIKLGILPGAGGTQRLPRAVGKSKAMDMVLTARMMDAAEAERAGLVSRVVPLAKLMDEALAAAAAICGSSLPAVMMAKESVNRAFEAPLSEGIRFERRLFHSLFGTADQKEGMDADPAGAAAKPTRAASGPPWSWTAVQVAEAIRRGRISSREATQSCLQRLRKVNPTVKAIAEVLEDQALTAADTADRQLARGRALPPLHGVPITTKINVDLGGYPTTNGIVAFKDAVAKGLFIEGLFASAMYLSPYRMHELALHGLPKVALDTLARQITRRTEPPVKLH